MLFKMNDMIYQLGIFNSLYYFLAMLPDKTENIWGKQACCTLLKDLPVLSSPPGTWSYLLFVHLTPYISFVQTLQSGP